MRTPDRTDTSLFGRWWWTVDRLSLSAVVILILIGAVLVIAGSPAVAHKIGVETYYFVKRQAVFLGLSAVTIVGLSLLDTASIRRIGAAGFLGSFMLLMLVPVLGSEIKGSVRWINLGGITLQPSEFIKPCFALLNAWLLARRVVEPGFPGIKLSVGLYAIVAAFLVCQPDIGMTVTLTGIWIAQLFLAGMPYVLIFLLGGMGIAAGVGAYFALPHVASRINRFLDPEAGENYQVERALEAFASGGLFGRGPGEGIVKRSIPDSHTDFIFAVAGEEFGMLFCFFILLLFTLIVLRSLKRVSHDPDLYVMIAAGGLVTQFGLQAVINMGVALHLLPTKGMTLPFLSYGGSSMLAFGLGVGALLALTRKRYGYGLKL